MTEPGRTEAPIPPSVQALRNLGGVSPGVAETSKLEFKSELPDIRMQVPPSNLPGAGPQPETGGNIPKTNLDPRMLEAAINYQNLLAQQETGSFQSLITKLRKLDEVSVEGVETKERELETEYQVLTYTTLEHNLFVANECLEYRNPYANWTSKPGRDVLQSFLTYLEQESFRIQVNKESGEKVSPTREAWIKRMYADFSWMRANYATQEGVGHLMKYYFSGIDGMLNALYEQRLNPLADDYRKTNGGVDKVPELAVSADEQKLSFGFTKLSSSERAGAQGVEVLPKKEGIRERAVRMQDERFHWEVVIAETGQIDWRSVKLGVNGQVEDFGKQHYEMKLTPDEVRLIVALFGKGSVAFGGKTVPEKILNWFALKPKDSNKKEYKALVEALVLENARANLSELNSLAGDAREQKLSELTTRIRKRADELKVKELGLTLEEKLARVVVRSGLVNDLGLGFSLKLGWGYEHSKGTREIVFAGVYTGKDDYTPGWPFHHDMIYDRRASKRSSLVIPTSADFREWAVLYPPTKWPDLIWGKDGAFERDPELKRAVEYLFGSTPEGAAWQRENGLSIDQETINILRAMMWGWGTAYTSDKITPSKEITHMDKATNKKEGSQHIIYASFIPKEIQVMMFFQTIKLGTKNDAGLEMTLWEELMSGTDPSKLNWGEMQTDAFDRWHVNMNMLGRTLSPLVDPLKEDFEKSFFQNTGGLKELLKRLYLGLRDESVKIMIDNPEKPKEAKQVEVPGPLLWCIFASELVALYLSSHNDLISRYYKEGTAHSSFINGLTEWIKTDLWMPGDVPGFENFSGKLTLLTWFAAKQLDRTGKEPGGGADEKRVYNKAVGIIKNIN